MNEAINEEARMKLLHLRALSAAVESTGQAKAEAEVGYSGSVSRCGVRLHVNMCPHRFAVL